MQVIRDGQCHLAVPRVACLLLRLAVVVAVVLQETRPELRGFDSVFITAGRALHLVARSRAPYIGETRWVSILSFVIELVFFLSILFLAVIILSPLFF